MKEKMIFIVSIVCLTLAILFSFFIIGSALFILDEAKSYAEEKTHINEETIETKKTETFPTKKEKQNAQKEVSSERDVIKKEKNMISLGEFKLTAYCSCEKCCGKWALNRPKDENGKDIVYGSTGNILVAGTSIAVDPSVIPYGSQVEINGHTYTAHDTGGAIKGNRIDVYFDSHQEARNFGVQFSEVFLIGDKQ